MCDTVAEKRGGEEFSPPGPGEIDGTGNTTWSDG